MHVCGYIQNGLHMRNMKWSVSRMQPKMAAYESGWMIIHTYCVVLIVGMSWHGSQFWHAMWYFGWCLFAISLVDNGMGLRSIALGDITATALVGRKLVAQFPSSSLYAAFIASCFQPERNCHEQLVGGIVLCSCKFLEEVNVRCESICSVLLKPLLSLVASPATLSIACNSVFFVSYFLAPSALFFFTNPSLFIFTNLISSSFSFQPLSLFHFPAHFFFVVGW